MDCDKNVYMNEIKNIVWFLLAFYRRTISIGEIGSDVCFTDSVFERSEYVLKRSTNHNIFYLFD